MLTWIASYPRSGNTFCRMALYRLYGCRSVGTAWQRNPAPSETRKLPEFGHGASLSDEELAAAGEMYFVKTHDLPGESRNRAIYLVRDGRDALVSYAWYHLVQDRGMRPEAVDHKHFRTVLYNLILEKRSPYGDWSQNVLTWLARPHTQVIRFENLIGAPEKTMAQVVAGLRLPNQKTGGLVPSFAQLQAQSPLHYRRGRVGSWRDEFPPDLLSLFWNEHGEAMKAAGYAIEAAGRNSHDRVAYCSAS